MMWVTGRQHLIMLEFVAGIDHDENRLVIYDANMEDTDSNELVELECPRQIHANEELRGALRGDTRRGLWLEAHTNCVIMEFGGMRYWQWVFFTDNPSRFHYIRAYWERRRSDSNRRLWTSQSLIDGRTPASLWKRIPNGAKRTFLKMISEGMLAKKRPARERGRWRRP